MCVCVYRNPILEISGIAISETCKVKDRFISRRFDMMRRENVKFTPKFRYTEKIISKAILL